jgi:peptidoglycan hydrolase FlgJ
MKVPPFSPPTSPERQTAVVDRAKLPPEMVEAAEGMEAMFIDYMMKVMRESVPKTDMGLDSPATGIYRSMQDTEMAQNAARAGGIGLADQILAYMQNQRSPGGQAVSVSRPITTRTGGTDEDQSIRRK